MVHQHPPSFGYLGNKALKRIPVMVQYPSVGTKPSLLPCSQCGKEFSLIVEERPGVFDALCGECAGVGNVEGVKADCGVRRKVRRT